MLQSHQATAPRNRTKPKSAQAKTKGTFVVSDEDRVKALEALLARQRAGSPAPGDAEKIRAIEALVDQQKAKKAAPGPVASPSVSDPTPTPKYASLTTR